MTRATSMYHLFFFNDTATTEIYTLSLHDALPISAPIRVIQPVERLRAELKPVMLRNRKRLEQRSEEHTSELQSRLHLVCRLLLEKKKNVPSHRCFSHSIHRSASP